MSVRRYLGSRSGAPSLTLASMIILAVGVGLILFAWWASGSLAPKGILQGRVWSYGCPAVHEGEECGFPAASYRVVVYRSDGVTVFAQTTTDANGYYTISLPAGEYVVYGDCHIQTPCRDGNGTPHQITIQAGQATELNITYDNGIR